MSLDTETTREVISKPVHSSSSHVPNYLCVGSESVSLSLPIQDVPAFTSSRVRIELDCTTAGSWCEIDAVFITGKRYRLRKYFHCINTMYTYTVHVCGICKETYRIEAIEDNI